MEKKQLSKEEMQDLARAISQLSEEDQMQIAAAGVITDAQCDKIKSFARIDCDYGAPCPDIMLPKQIADPKKAKTESQPPIAPKNPMDAT